MRNKLVMLLGGVLLAAVVVTGIVLWNPFTASSERLSEDEIAGKVGQLYPEGAITETTLEGDVYRVRLESDQGKYELAVDARKGSIVSIEQLAKGTIGSGDTGETAPEPGTIPTPDSGTDPGEAGDSAAEPGGKGIGDGPGEPAGSGKGNPEGPPMQMVTKEHAVKVSLAKVPGTVEDVEYREEDDSRFYLVEIETKDEREATVQVHAITGQIMSLTWDD